MVDPNDVAEATMLLGALSEASGVALCFGRVVDTHTIHVQTEAPWSQRRLFPEARTHTLAVRAAAEVLQLEASVRATRLAELVEKHFPPTTPCDVTQGPCACGAWHLPGERR